MNNKNMFPFERNRYFYGKMLTARDLETEQKYMNDKRRLINKALFGSGVVCGLGVYKNDENTVSVESGFALDNLGREIVVETPVISKIAALEGYENLPGHEQCFLCLAYHEEGRELVSPIGKIDREAEQFNKIVETYRLYLDTAMPNYEALFEQGGRNLVHVLYNNKDLTLVQIVPATIVAGEELKIEYLLVKKSTKPPVKFDIEFESDYFQYDGKEKIGIGFKQNAPELDEMTRYTAVLGIGPFAEKQVALNKTAFKITVQMGDYTDIAELDIQPDIYICRDKKAQLAHQLLKISSLSNTVANENLPIYLAKINYSEAGNIPLIREAVFLPFEQIVLRAAVDKKQQGTGTKAALPQNMETQVEVLDYWQKPDVSVHYNPKKKSMCFNFGIPSLEAYDYATASGVVKIPLTGTIKVNSRFVSEEISHTLGIGDIALSLSVEFDAQEDTGQEQVRRLLFGSGEVFAAKGANKTVPRIETAAILYPEKGTFKAGIWCLDHVPGRQLTINWFAFKPSRDTALSRTFNKGSIKIMPEIQRIKVREQVNYRADVRGIADKSVLWTVKDINGGVIDSKGIYRAPSIPGTYEIAASSALDPSVAASAFIIVEE